MELVRVEPQLVAVVKRNTRWDQLGDAIRSAMAVDLAPVRARQVGHMIFVYRPGSDGTVELGCGFQVAEVFPTHGEIVCDRIPGGMAAHALHRGPYSELKSTWDPLLAAIRAQGLPTHHVQWELYGDHHPDPAELRTDVYVLVQPDAT